MDDKETLILKLQTGKLAMICEFADALFQTGDLNLAKLDELEQNVIRRIKNADFAEWISDREQVAIMETGIDVAQSDFALLRNRLRAVTSGAGSKPGR
jgi:hypothetical protein